VRVCLATHQAFSSGVGWLGVLLAWFAWGTFTSFTKTKAVRDAGADPLLIQVWVLLGQRSVQARLLSLAICVGCCRVSGVRVFVRGCVSCETPGGWGAGSRRQPEGENVQLPLPQQRLHRAHWRR
jgi:hypothetical protein